MSTFYYLAQGRSLEIVQRFFEERDAMFHATLPLLEETGAVGVYTDGLRVVGFRMPPAATPNPKLLRRDRKLPDMWVPAARCNQGKTLRDKMTALPEEPSIEQLTRDLIGTPWINTGPLRNGGFMGGCAGVERVGEALIILLPKPALGTPPTPLDAIPLKASDYWSRVEVDGQSIQSQ